MGMETGTNFQELFLKSLEVDLMRRAKKFMLILLKKIPFQKIKMKPEREDITQ